MDKNGLVPEIRFKGFTDAWVQRKLVNQIESIIDLRGKSPAKFGMEWGSVGYLVLSALNVKDGYIDKTIEAKYGDDDLYDRWMGDSHLEEGDVLFTTEAPLGNIAQIPDSKKYILNQRIVAFKLSPSKLDNNFLAQFLRSPNFQETLSRMASGGTAKGIGMKEFAKLYSNVPQCVDEQTHSGKFFRTLDTAITQTQRKLEGLRGLKKGYLQRLFPQGDERVPQLRFAEFSGEWQERRLGDISTKITDKNKSNEHNETFTNSAEFGIVSQRVFFDKDISNSKNLDGYYISAWEADRNQRQKGVNWQFTAEDARLKLKRLYPTPIFNV